MTSRLKQNYHIVLSDGVLFHTSIFNFTRVIVCQENIDKRGAAFVHSVVTSMALSWRVSTLIHKCCWNMEPRVQSRDKATVESMSFCRRRPWNLLENWHPHKQLTKQRGTIIRGYYASFFDGLSQDGSALPSRQMHCAVSLAKIVALKLYLLPHLLIRQIWPPIETYFPITVARKIFTARR